MAKKKKNFEKRETQMMLEFLDKGQVLQEWDLKIKKMKKIGKDYKLKTYRGEKLLKVGFQEERIMFMNLALEHLARNGCFKGIPRLIPTKYGDFYIKSDLGIYYLTDWIAGKEGKTKDMNQVIGFVKFLAEIHLASKKFEPVPYWALRERWDDISHQIARKIERVNGNLPQLPSELQEAWLTYQSKAQKAQNLLKVSGYQLLKEMAKRDRTLCHRQFTPGHGVICKGTINIFHWEHCAYGVQVSDLVYYLQKIMPSFDWNYHVGEQVITAYHQVKPLLREEVMTLGAALMFPTTFVKLVEKFLLGKIAEDKIKAKIEQVKEREEKKTAFLEEFFTNQDLRGFCWGENALPLSNAWYILSSRDLKHYAERRGKDISSLLVQRFTVSAQGRLQEEPDKEKHGIPQSCQVPIFPVMYTPKSGQERENVLQVLADHYLRDRLLDEIDNFLKDNDFPGVNINFEVCSEEEMVSFNKFIKSLSRIAHEQEKLLLVSVAAAKGENLFYDYQFLDKYADYLLVEIMEEDMSCPGSPVSKDFIQAAITYAAAHLPKEKIVAVLPVHRETTESVLEKAFLARQFGIAGCAFWRVGLEDPKIWSRKPSFGFLAKKIINDEDEDGDGED